MTFKEPANFYSKVTQQWIGDNAMKMMQYHIAKNQNMIDFCSKCYETMCKTQCGWPQLIQ